MNNILVEFREKFCGDEYTLWATKDSTLIAYKQEELEQFLLSYGQKEYERGRGETEKVVLDYPNWTKWERETLTELFKSARSPLE